MTSNSWSEITSITVERAFGESIEGKLLLSTEGFSPRYDLDRWTGEISRPGHAIEGENIKDKILVFPTAKGGMAAGWALYDLKAKGIGPRALIFGMTNTVMVQGAVFAGIPITEGWSPDPFRVMQTGDLVRLDTPAKRIHILRRDV